MILAAHQPNFLPWLGYFGRMIQADRFIFLDHVQFERQNYQNRTLIKTTQGPRWITVPVAQRSWEESILEKRICEFGAPNGPCLAVGKLLYWLNWLNRHYLILNNRIWTH
ncbi:MAG: WbqC family protein [Elusimicrobia bacterium]|nr:WbqC family protein [Elusimicrobiota bacterium]